MPVPPLVRCAIYARQSVDPRPGDAELSSCARQHDACFRFILEHREQGWIPLPADFDDEGYSGASLERPGLQRLLEAVRRGEVDRVVVYHLDRLSRRVADWALLLDLFSTHGASLVVVCGGLFSDQGPMARLQGALLASFAEEERTMMRERIADARAALRSRGLRSAGRVPYGYLTEPGSKRLVAHPTEAPVVREIFTVAARGTTPADIADDLNARTIPTKNGKPGGWQARTILRLLRNPVYLGRLSDGSPGAHGALVDQALFDEALAGIEARRTRSPSARRGHGRRDPFLLRGLLVCAQCGRPMTTSASGRIKWSARSASPWTSRAPLAYYRCRSGRTCAGSQQPAPELERYVLSVLMTPPAGSPAWLASFGSYVRAIWNLLIPENRPGLLRKYVRALVVDPQRDRLTIEYDQEAIVALVRDRARRLSEANQVGSERCAGSLP